MPPSSGTSTRPSPPTTSTSGMPRAMSPRDRPHHTLTTRAPPTTANASASTTPTSGSTAPAASSRPRPAREDEQQAPGDRAEVRTRPAARPAAERGGARVPGERFRRCLDAGLGPRGRHRRRHRQRRPRCRGGRRRRCGRAGSRTPLVLRVARAQPQHGGAERDEQHRPERAVAADRPPQPAPDREQPERHEPVAEQLPAVGVRRLDPGRGRRHREHDPAEQVGDHAHTTQERGDDERQPHQDHVDAQVVGHPARHPAQQAFVGAARQPPGRGRRSSGRGVGPGRVRQRVRFDRRCVHGRDHPRPAGACHHRGSPDGTLTTAPRSRGPPRCRFGDRRAIIGGPSAATRTPRRASDPREPDVRHASGAPITTRHTLARRSRQKVVAGVAGGIGDHFHIEAGRQVRLDVEMVADPAGDTGDDLLP